jgi:predicted adenylyl cyclase CyaB
MSPAYPTQTNHMNIEYEASFYPIDIDEMRTKLKTIYAKLTKPECLMKRQVFYPPKSVIQGWMRVRDEGDQITLAYKYVDGDKNKITDQKETEIIINNFEAGCNLLESIGCVAKSFQESKREIWHYNNIEICLDTWPGLKPVIEIEGQNMEEVKNVAEKLDLNWSEAIFDSIAHVYEKELKVSRHYIKTKPKLTFINPPSYEDYLTSTL